MIYLSGCVREEALAMPDLGLMLTPMMGNAPNLARAIWAADTGCFSQPDAYAEAAYLSFLSVREKYAKRCLFATAPDVVGNAEATLERSLPVLPKIRRLGYRAALVAQDGLEHMDIPWHAFDALFIGGTTKWKLSEAAYSLAGEAGERGKWVHMGRVNSWRRLKAAAVSGYDSADGTFLRFGPDVLMPQVQRWIETLRGQAIL